MKINMYSIIDLLTDKYSIPFSCGIDSENIDEQAIRKFMYMLTVNIEMRNRAADYNLFLAGVFDDETGDYYVDPSFDTIVNGADVVKYLDDPSIPTYDILEKINDERIKNV